MTQAFDLFVIGGGSAGVRAARVAAGHGAKVALAEAYRYGGTCVIRGCVPKKLLVLASRFADEFENARDFGWDIGEAGFDWAALRAAKDREIGRLEQVYREGLERAGVRAIDARAAFDGPRTIRLSTGETVQARHVLIATGNVPVRPDIPGAELAITSNEVFDLPRLPESMLIVGGGFIAAEFSCLLQRLGTRITVAYRGGRILRGFDDDLRRHLCDGMAEAGIEIRNDVVITAIRRDGARLRVETSPGAPLHVDAVMFATGRRPSVDGLGLQAAGVALDERGAIRVTPDSRTSADGVWAVGDVTDRLQLTPVAIREGHAFADTVFGDNPWVCDHDTVPFAVFSTPEIGTVGLTEARARQAYPNVDVYRSTFRPLGNALSARARRALVKLVVERDSDRVVGVHLCGPDAAEMVQAVAIAVKMGATKRQFDATVALHPTAAEELVTMREPLPDPGR